MVCKENHKQVVIAVCLLFTTNLAWGLEWQLQRGLDLGLGYSDNLNFSFAEIAENGPTVNLTPFVEVSAIGTKSQLSFLAEGRYRNLPNQRYASFVPEFDANLNLELVQDMFSTNVRASVIQVESNGQAVFEGATALSSYTSNQYFGNINSNFNYNFGNFSHLEVDHAYSLIDNSDDDISDSSNHTSRLIWAELSRAGQPDWSFEGRHQRTDSSEVNDHAELFSLIGEFGIFTGREVLLTGRVGNEWINSSSDDAESRDDIWGLTLAWRPNAQNSLELGYGERSFGSNPSFEYSLIGRRVTFSAHWRRNYANTRLVSSIGGTSNEDTTTTLVTEEATTGAPEHLLVERQLSVDNEIGMSFLLRGRLSEILIEGVYFVREDQVDRIDVKNALISASFNRRLNANTRWEIMYSYREQLSSTAVVSSFENRVQFILRYLK